LSSRHRETSADERMQKPLEAHMHAAKPSDGLAAAYE
jgi:hypothetical protein